MTNKELFIDCYNAYLDFEQATNTLNSVHVLVDDSVFTVAFYTIFDLVMNRILSEEGLNFLYEEILFEGYTSEEALEELTNYFI